MMNISTTIIYSLNEPEEFTNSFTVYGKNIVPFWSMSVIFLCIGGVAIIGNGLVLYAYYGSRNLGILRELDGVIKSLAVADLLFGLIGIPSRIGINYYLGMRMSQYVILCNNDYTLNSFN